MREEIRHIQALMEGAAYITDPAISTAVHLATTLRKPLLVEGHAGVGKTEIAKVLARVRGTNLIRLQCYEGLDASTALYEWNYPKQILRIRLEERDERSVSAKEADIFSEDFLLKRPLLQAITQTERAPVLLIDEIDRADIEFESFLLEVLSDFQVTVPEIGTITAVHRPGRRADVEPLARPVGRPPPALPLPVDRLPLLRQGGAHPPDEGAGDQRAPGRPDRARHAEPPPPPAPEGARRGREPRLGRRAGRRSTPTTSTPSSRGRRSGAS